MSKNVSQQKHKRHSDEFKEEALKLADRIGVTDAADRLGVYPSQIYSWRSALNKNRTRGERESILATENARLKRQVAEQAEELEILKKAATYFAKLQK
jgi:transposase